ncbi:MAG TPA: DUF357 domain-containing protein [Candidatus Thalassarchaeaceae archaeon]|jgi:hypothetical protein|nr:hypothetical protein [Euryarchaeota archaeon]DAC42991.1 MAG TPA: DUF357 domain-containing protein [Candidatus Poseidoniales archaeon]HII35240.1 DUF357 domain-containing protein [Candidatus Thalassarchaeaceae archaeon]|tara:strand:+ start:20527 stop:20820 length:294 start_codon:yes stop_codon:yes gene_type:complete
MAENKIITEERVQKYISITLQARSKATPNKLSNDDQKRLDSMMRMCDDYFSDAKHFLNNGDLVRAFGAINYSHAWIDAAVRIGFMDGHGDDILFTLP